MSPTDREPLLLLTSGAPWHLELTVESVGPDFLCRIHGGDHHVGAVALAQWRNGRADVDHLVVGSHKEGSLATHAAHQLCRASRRSVTCVAGIHFDDLTKGQIEDIVQTTFGLTVEAARQLDDRRMRSRLAGAKSLYEELAGAAREILPVVDALLATPLEDLLESSRERIAESQREQFGNRVRVFAPLYLSNACPNDCAYCGFRRSARFDRIRLSVDEAVSEATQLAASGFRSIDLVTGEIPSDAFVGYVTDTVRAIRDHTAIERIHLNLGALGAAQYRRLRAAGAQGYHLYQESYDPEVYFLVHRRGRKRDMESRLAASLRALEAGFEAFGMGILLGLGPVREDLAALAAHADLLARRFPAARIGFSLPRLRAVDPECDYAVGATVDDELFIKSMLFLRRRYPRAHLTLTTRERPDLRDALLPLGITKISAGVSTAPGGYTDSPRDDTEQFAVCDQRPLGVILDVIRNAGLTPALD